LIVSAQEHADLGVRTADARDLMMHSNVEDPRPRVARNNPPKRAVCERQSPGVSLNDMVCTLARSLEHGARHIDAHCGGAARFGERQQATFTATEF
jgi:hypothetical protein